VYAQTRVLHQPAQEGYPMEEVLARLSPYLTAHVNRFRSYAFFRRQVPPPLGGVSGQTRGPFRTTVAVYLNGVGAFIRRVCHTQ
jgi:hypothetical protein